MSFRVTAVANDAAFNENQLMLFYLYLTLINNKLELIYFQIPSQD